MGKVRGALLYAQCIATNSFGETRQVASHYLSPYLVRITRQVHATL